VSKSGNILGKILGKILALSWQTSLEKSWQWQKTWQNLYQYFGKTVAKCRENLCEISVIFFGEVVG
jgi:hypothetical protein